MDAYKTNMKQVLISKIKTKYVKEIKKSKMAPVFIESEVDRFLKEHEKITQENLLQLDSKIKIMLTLDAARNKPASPLPTVGATMLVPSSSIIESRSSQNISHRNPKDIWGKLVEYNAKEYEKDQQNYLMHIAESKKKMKAELDAQLEQNRKLKNEQEKCLKSLEKDELLKAIEKEQMAIQKEKLKKSEINNELKNSCKIFEGIL